MRVSGISLGIDFFFGRISNLRAIFDELNERIAQLFFTIKFLFFFFQFSLFVRGINEFIRKSDQLNARSGERTLLAFKK